MKEVELSGLQGKARGHYPFQNFQDSLEEDNNPKRSGRVVGGLAWFIQNDAISSFKGGGMVPLFQQRGEEVCEEVGGSQVHSFPH